MNTSAVQIIIQTLLVMNSAALMVASSASAVAGDQPSTPWTQNAGPQTPWAQGGHPTPSRAEATATVTKVHSPTATKSAVQWKVDVQVERAKDRELIVEVELCNAAGACLPGTPPVW